MKGGKYDKRWITINEYVDVDTGEILGHNKPKEYSNTEIINKEYTEDDKYRIIKRTIGCRHHGKQCELEFKEYRT